jgi:hypothetical protein
MCRYSHRRREVAEENHNQSNERMLFHGSPFIQVHRYRYSPARTVYCEMDYQSRVGFGLSTLKFLAFLSY